MRILLRCWGRLPACLRAEGASRGMAGKAGFLIQFILLSVLAGVPNIVFGSGGVKIPDMNVLGDDLSLYGLAGITAADLPKYDKESFILEKFFKSGFTGDYAPGQSFVSMLSAGAPAEASVKAAFLSRGAHEDSGFIAGADRRFYGEDGRRRFLYDADLFYKRKGLWSFYTLPYFSGRDYELPGSASSDINENLTGIPLHLYSQTENYFISFSAEQVLMTGSYPAGFYAAGRSADFSSTRLAAAVDQYMGSSSFSFRAGLSREDWDWADGSKKFDNLSSDFSLTHKFDSFDLVAGLEFMKWAGSAYTAGKFLVSFPALGGAVTAGLDPDNSAPQIEALFARRASLLRVFPVAAHEGWQNLRAEYVLSLYPAGLKLTAGHFDTRDFFYADESAPSPGSLESARYKRDELGAELSLLSGPVSSGIRFFYAAAPNFLPVPRSSAAVFTEYKKGRIKLNALLNRVSKGPWTESFVNGLVKICYTVPSGATLFLAADNVFGNKVFLMPSHLPVSPYEWRDSAFFSAGLEIRWGQF
ncbi:MAG: hypothetical protein COZ15_04435 [Elusimicrobia bacterium CG_4_10_14_3_um_filter_49_12_50_7]|nr:MAG: hypothetical protein COS41_06100 [Elusimicrobia bacterium CG03_land_8_20_14_0_80_50_18]PIY16741.1 MAG: hypothetical protein COZ15_04435 [Elusimicrobia bacterium CG_4_10_14_3_um_filter_49_12_50_7]